MKIIKMSEREFCSGIKMSEREFCSGIKMSFVEAIKRISFVETQTSQQSSKYVITKLQVKIVFPNLKKYRGPSFVVAPWTIFCCWIGLDSNYFHPIWVLYSPFKAQQSTCYVLNMTLHFKGKGNKPFDVNKYILQISSVKTNEMWNVNYYKINNTKIKHEL